MDKSIYSLLLGVFAVVGLVWSASMSVQGVKSDRQKESAIFTALNSGMATLAGMLIGARVSYILFQISEFESNRWEVFDLARGGLDWTGVTLGGLIALLLYAGFSNVSPLKLFDINLPLISMMVMGTWLGAQITGVGYGPVMENSWWALPILDDSGDALSRGAYSIFGAILTLFLIFLMDRFGGKIKFPGAKLLLFAPCQYAIIFSLTFFRKDPMLQIGDYPMERIAALIHFVIVLAIIVILVIVNARKISAQIITVQKISYKSNSE